MFDFFFYFNLVRFRSNIYCFHLAVVIYNYHFYSYYFSLILFYFSFWKCPLIVFVNNIHGATDTWVHASDSPVCGHLWERSLQSLPSLPPYPPQKSEYRYHLGKEEKHKWINYCLLDAKYLSAGNSGKWDSSRVTKNCQKVTCSRLPFCTLSHRRKISSPPSTEPQVLSMREIFRLEALGDSAKTPVWSCDSWFWADESVCCVCPLAAGLTAVIDGLGDGWLQSSGVVPITVRQVCREFQSHHIQIHLVAQLFDVL